MCSSTKHGLIHFLCYSVCGSEVKMSFHQWARRTDKAFTCQRQRECHHATRRNGDNFLSACDWHHVCVSCDTVLENQGMASVYIRDNSDWRWRWKTWSHAMRQSVNGLQLWDLAEVFCQWPEVSSSPQHPAFLWLQWTSWMAIPAPSSGCTSLAGAKKWIDSLFHSPFINSEGLEAQWFNSLNYFSSGGVAAIAKSAANGVTETQGRSYDILCPCLHDYVLDKCVCASARPMALAVVPRHVITKNVRSPRQFSLPVILNNEPK